MNSVQVIAALIRRHPVVGLWKAVNSRSEEHYLLQDGREFAPGND